MYTENRLAEKLKIHYLRSQRWNGKLKVVPSLGSVQFVVKLMKFPGFKNIPIFLIWNYLQGRYIIFIIIIAGLKFWFKRN